ncbi:MAG: RHS repeat-associated core domain-containing protein, partial [Bacteroidales bacterium]|nr:RHS repeat-associated core domain-containing protein [Bacteroidales bacterium]
YKNSSNGHPVTVTYNDMQNKSYTTTITYDAIGRQTSITDPDAGTVSYEYDALDRITKQTDARGNVTTNTYNAAGLLTKTVCGDITTTYSYDNHDRLTKESTGNQSVSYTYDNLNRTTKKTYSIDGTNFAYTYTYNTNGQLSSKTFPDGVTENYTYGNGYLNRIDVNSQRVWERGMYNGTVRQASLGMQPLNLTRKYSTKGMLVQQEIVRQAGSLHKMTYSFDDKTGNMTSRTGMFSSPETFSYDNFDRLTKIAYGSTAATRLSYDLNGNITNKTGIGSYTYDNDDKPHAVRQVQNTDNTIPNTNQSITYNAINKVSSITQGGDILTITYGPTHQRCKTVLISGGSTTTTLYADNYEQRTTNGTTTAYHYVDSPDGIAAILVKKGDGKATPYYVETDHLGSILNLYDEWGDVHYSATYDAWGVQTITRNNISLTRGYCGHEHWSQFGLIDMNGRFYDPLLGRFLSPDPYVQAPENPQNLNRYSYCLNNPLKYTDPSGETIIGAFIIGGIVGAYIGGSLANDNYKPAKWNYNNWTTWRYMFWGSVVGGASGALGGFIATSGMPFANTASIAFSSFYNSLGTSFYSDRQTPISISFGLVSYDFTNNSWGFLGKKGNEFIENFGYAMGALANVQDLMTAVVGGGENININSASTKKGNDWWGHSSATHENGERLISFGPDSQVDKSSSLSETWKNSIKNAKEWDTYFGKKGTWSLKLNNVSTTAISKYASGVTRWDLFFNSCVGHTTRALWRAGIPTLYTFHPHMLNVQLAIRQIGIESSPYIYQLNK